MLAGADLIALPTNWPESGGCAVPDFVVPTRALENKVYYAAVNRVGTERGVKFIGRSSIVDPSGKTLAAAVGIRTMQRQRAILKIIDRA